MGSCREICAGKPAREIALTGSEIHGCCHERNYRRPGGSEKEWQPAGLRNSITAAEGSNFADSVSC